MERVLAQRYTAGVIAAFCRNNQVDADILPRLVGDVLTTWLRLDLPVETSTPDFPVTKGRRRRPEQQRPGTPARRPRAAAVADAAALPQVGSSPEPDDEVTEQAAPVSLQMPEPVRGSDLASEPARVPQPPPAIAAEETLPDRDSPEMKRHTLESVFGKPPSKRQRDTAPAQGSLPGTEPVVPRAKRTPFSQQSLRRLRS